MTYKNVVRNYILGNLFYDMIFIYAVYNVIIYTSGLSYSKVGLLLSLWAIFAFLLEIPTGIIGDFFNRKSILVITPLIKSLTFLLWMYAGDSFILYCLGFFFWALASSLKSGTHQAYIYDYLRTVKNTSSYKEIVSTLIKYKQIVIGFSMVFGAMVYTYSTEKVYIYSIVSLGLSSLFFSFLPNQTKIDNINIKNISEIFKIKLNKNLVYVLLIVLAVSVTGSTEEFDQLYYSALNISSLILGVLALIASLFTSLGAHMASKYKASVFTSISLMSILYLLTAVFFNYIGILFLYLMYVFYGFLSVYTEVNIQESIDSDNRATLTSVVRMIENIFGSLIIILFTAFADEIGVNIVFGFAGIILVIVLIIIHLYRKMYNIYI